MLLKLDHCGSVFRVIAQQQKCMEIDLQIVAVITGRALIVKTIRQKLMLDFFNKYTGSNLLPAFSPLELTENLSEIDEPQCLAGQMRVGTVMDRIDTARCSRRDATDAR